MNFAFSTSEHLLQVLVDAMTTSSHSVQLWPSAGAESSISLMVLPQTQVWICLPGSVQVASVLE